MALNAGNFTRQFRRADLKDELIDKLGPNVATLTRKQIRATLSTNRKGKSIDHLNERLAADELTLHPTKGYRTITAFRTVVSLITTGMKTGMVGDYSVAGMREAIGRKVSQAASA